MKKTILKFLLLTILCSGIGVSNVNAQLTITTKEMIATKELCINNAISNAKKVNVTPKQISLLKRDYLISCMSDAWQQENIIPQLQFTEINKTTKDKILKEVPKLTANSILLISTSLFNIVRPKVINKTITDEEKAIAREISYAMKKRILEIHIPASMMNLPLEQRNLVVQPFLENFKKSKILFQNLDSVLYDYRQSIQVITLIEKAKTKEEKSQLNFNKDGCEISQTYMDNQLINSCK